ncbi:MAG: HAMP domain-containing sensor histidine kinase [Solirubrobacteraceae bacterium]
MRPRWRLSALGLRGRIVGVVVVTTVATLGVAAIALLGPLENSLRNAAQKTLQQRELKNVTRQFKSLALRYDPLPYLASPDPSAAIIAQTREYNALLRAEQSLGNAIGATVVVRGYVDQWGGSQPVFPVNPNEIPQSDSFLLGLDNAPENQRGSYGDVAAAARTGDPQYGFQSINGTENVTAAIPLPQKGFYLAVRKPIGEIPDAVNAVRKALLYAVLAGLALSILLGVPLAARLVRRLRRLRLAALRLAAGGPSEELLADRSRDEVGDLARSFAVMQERLSHQEEARRAFVATASHELRTPLTSLEGMLEMLEEDLEHDNPDLVDSRSLVGSARAQARRLSRLAADLLDLSRIDAEVALRSEPIELAELSRAVLAEFDLGTRARGITTGLEESDGPVWALGDPGSVARILRILLDNAVRITPPGTEVTVALSRRPVPKMSVRDHGPGVEESERELIFERFHRGRATGGDAGFGLGLAIGRELAARMGGSLVLEPSDGDGAQFTLTLPAARAAEEDPLLIM